MPRWSPSAPTSARARSSRPCASARAATGASATSRRGSARGVRARLRLPDAPRQRDLRGRVPARHLDRAPAHRQAPGRDRAQRRAPTRSRTAPPARATTRCASSSPTPRSRPASSSSRRGASGTSKARTSLIAYAEQQRHPGPGDAREAVQHRPQPAPRQLRGRHPRGSVARAVRRHVPARRSRPRRRPTSPSTSRSSYEDGDPVAVNGERLVAGGAARAAERRSRGAHGVGRVDLVENRYVGMKSRGVYETPGRHRAAASPTAPSSR